jgi:hypothetical protein
MTTIISAQTHNYRTIPGADYSGWLEQAKNDTIPDLGKFSAEWIAPSPPSNTSSTSISFLFNGIMPQNVTSNMTVLIQPVLEWNNGETNTECYDHWCARPWYIIHDGTPDGEAFNTEENYVSVDTGDRITGSMDWNNDTQNWTITITDNTQSSSLFIDDDTFWTDNLKVTCALEGYQINDNSDLPGSTIFSNMQFKDTDDQNVNFNWESWYNPMPPSSLPGLFVEIPSQYNVTLFTDKKYSINATSGSNGNITPDGIVEVLRNRNATFNITPIADYVVQNITVDGTSFPPATSYTFTNVIANHTINATFAPEIGIEKCRFVFPDSINFYTVNGCPIPYLPYWTGAISAVGSSGFLLEGWMLDGKGPYIELAAGLSTPTNTSCRYIDFDYIESGVKYEDFSSAVVISGTALDDDTPLYAGILDPVNGTHYRLDLGDYCDNVVVNAPSVLTNDPSGVHVSMGMSNIVYS